MMDKDTEIKKLKGRIKTLEKVSRSRKTMHGFTKMEAKYLFRKLKEAQLEIDFLNDDLWTMHLRYEQ